MKVNSAGTTCLCCRTSTPLPYKSAGASDLTPELKVVEIALGKTVAELDTKQDKPLFANWWPNRAKVLLLTASRALVALNEQLKPEKELVRTKILGNPIQLMTYDSGDLVLLADERRVEVYSGTTWELQYEWSGGEGEWITAATCLGDGKYVAWATARAKHAYPAFLREARSPKVYVYDLQTGKIVATIR
ncbi:MAG: hypothetical protein RMI91_14930 [Gemmatales bacterium]|nr:hypothetical protein [Gemmatales bacterium]MDW7995938.1 hypothetical protein [Gemmatales bacterium]